MIPCGEYCALRLFGPGGLRTHMQEGGGSPYAARYCFVPNAPADRLALATKLGSRWRRGSAVKERPIDAEV
jgi:hypothetical protein